MGFTTKDIAVITEPSVISLSGNPNFVVIASKPGTKKQLEVKIRVKAVASESLMDLVIKDFRNSSHILKGTKDPSSVNDTTFFVSDTASDTAENIRQSLLADKWIAANFEIVILPLWENDMLVNGNTLHITSKNAGKEYNIDITAPNDIQKEAYDIVWVNATSQNTDSISGEESTAEIEIDIFANTGIFLGEVDNVLDPQLFGKSLISLQKTYAGAPVWFDLNGLFSYNSRYRLKKEGYGWFDPQTLTDIRFSAKLRGINSVVFYQSDILYILNGYGNADMSQYVYEGSPFRLLTNKPLTTYVRGQKAFLNFILSDPEKGVSIPTPLNISVKYTAYSTGGAYLGAVYDHPLERPAATVVNSCLLNIDNLLDAYPACGRVRIELVRGTSIISDYLEYTVLPSYLHSLNDFTFLNALGGWDSFNFDAPAKNDNKGTVETFTKTVTPTNTDSEKTYITHLKEEFTVESAPVCNKTAQWLKELAKSVAIYDKEGNYIIIEDFTLAITDAGNNMQKAILKYRYGKN